MYKIINRIISFSALGLLIYEYGFVRNSETFYSLQILNYSFLIFFILNNSVQLLLKVTKFNWFQFLSLLTPLLTLFLITYNSVINDYNIINEIDDYQFLFILSLIFIIFPEIDAFIRYLYKKHLSPMIILTSSFLFLIFIGTMLLLLPNSSTSDISFIDALFTSTSAVTVTGLSVFDIGTKFTFLGQLIILILIQFGGLGMLTFTSFFAFFFKGANSYQENLYMQDFFSTEKISGLLNFAFKIVIFTFLIEIIGAILIYYFLPSNFYNHNEQEIFFSIFHSISAFCNAGFSTISDGLYNETIRFNYNILNTIAILFIIGGLGYNVMFQLFKYIKVKIKSVHLKYISKSANYKITIGVVGLNTRIVFYSTILLLLIGTSAFFIFEYNNSLVEHTSFYGKISTAFFAGSTPRTAGYNSVNYSQLLDVTIMFTIFLMWIGASPASTGGGIKTTTFAVLILNIYSTIKGKNRVEIGTKEINNESKNRAFSVVTISLLILGLSTTLVASFEPQMSFNAIVFETFSAYSTVGLSLGVTNQFSEPSKLVLIIIMTIGRIGAFNILVGFFKSSYNLKYKYTEELIMIN